MDLFSYRIYALKFMDGLSVFVTVVIGDGLKISGILLHLLPVQKQ